MNTLSDDELQIIFEHLDPCTASVINTVCRIFKQISDKLNNNIVCSSKKLLDAIKCGDCQFFGKYIKTIGHINVISSEYIIAGYIGGCVKIVNWLTFSHRCDIANSVCNICRSFDCSDFHRCLDALCKYGGSKSIKLLDILLTYQLETETYFDSISMQYVINTVLKNNRLSKLESVEFITKLLNVNRLHQNEFACGHLCGNLLDDGRFDILSELTKLPHTNVTYIWKISCSLLSYFPYNIQSMIGKYIYKYYDARNFASASIMIIFILAILFVNSISVQRNINCPV